MPVSQQIHRIALASVLVTFVSGCMAVAPSQSGSAYARGQARQVQEVHLGYVEGVREVRLEGTRSPVGTLAGAALGGIAASNVGGGRGKTAATIGGAVLGGLGGAAAEQALTQRAGIEVTVRLDNGRMLAISQEADTVFYRGQRVRVMQAPDGTARVVHD